MNDREFILSMIFIVFSLDLFFIGSLVMVNLIVDWIRRWIEKRIGE